MAILFSDDLVHAVSVQEQHGGQRDPVFGAAMCSSLPQH
ncbi:hypothetical protein PAJL_2493 [Cutibacterium acnes HL042PA3]|nr:hypothetical protein HMPREF9206_1399 [Cutibacterium acnes J139]ESK58027.1 hypothetical protein PAJL_2493 [Cutibacterium acnes HL042PA3]